MIKFTIPYPKTKAGMKDFCKRFGLNAYYAGKPWPVRKADATEWHSMTKAMLMSQKVPAKMFENPVVISFYWNDNMDCSNHAAIGKMVEDALKGWIIKDDNRQHVKGICHWFHDQDYILIEVQEMQR